MRYGFVIDHNRCIGCHACSVACKEEHNVPLGVYRTWVKYIEKGEYPNAKRHFGVLRCNHCDAAPCIEICPTVALFRRDDGIVDFDSERCIGCKSCMQACPYDALYLDPQTHTAAKCNFCAHRVEVGLEPACVIVCPEQAIIAGDLDDPASRASRLVAGQKVRARKPEKNTQPKLFYVGIDEDLLRPDRMAAQPTYLWAEKNSAADVYLTEEAQKGKPGSSRAREVYDVSHPAPWGSKIAAYLWTKSIGGGVLIVATILFALGFDNKLPLLTTVGPTIALVFTFFTVFLLVIDLKRPERFYYLLTKPNLKSWLVLGGYVLMLYALAAFIWLFTASGSGGSVPMPLAWLGAALGACAACYSAFLFAQAKGRDLWLSPFFIWNLLAQAVTAGAAVLLICAISLEAGAILINTLAKVLAASVALNVSIVLGELYLARATDDARTAMDLLKRGSLKESFWAGAIGFGAMLPLVLLIASGFRAEADVAYILASVSSLIGLWIFEDLWIKAGQAVPLS
jgi:Fe-S-cluster-containing dehydrogenase component/formate-dependent nitrite reductase membrane component NrfD